MPDFQSSYDFTYNEGGSNNAIKDFQTTGNIKSKSSKDWGLKIAKAINSEIQNAYFKARNDRFLVNRRLANGKQNIDEFKTWFSDDGKIDYIKLRFKAIMIVSTAIQRMVGRWMQNNEKVTVRAVDKISKKQREDEYNEVEFVMNNKGMIGELEQASGVPIVKPNQVIPEDKDELDLWATEEQRIPEEIGFEIGVNHVLSANGWFDIIKRKTLTDSAEVGLIGCETTMQRDGMILVEWLKPENIFYSETNYPDFRDTTYRGYIKNFKIIEIREEYPHLGEETLWLIAQKSTNFPKSNLYGFDPAWFGASERPYDDWGVDANVFYLKTSDSEISRMSVTKGGSLKVDKKQSIPKDKGNNTYIKKDKYNIYKGIHIRDTEIMLEWGLQKNMIRPQDPQELGDVEFPISLYMYNMYEMRNLAVPEKIEEPAEALILTRLKIQQLVAKMRPAGNAYDITAMRELDLGTGDLFNPLELKKISDQTGDFYFSGKDAEGNNIGFPITPQTNAEGLPQLQGLIAVYNHHLQVMRDELGENENASGQTPKPRVTNDNYQASLAVSFNATDYMQDAYLYLMKSAAKKVSCLLYDSVIFGGKQYREIMKETEVKGRIFSTDAELLPTEAEVQYLDSLVTNAIQVNPEFILFCDPFKIRRIARENVRLAEIYFRNAQKRAIKGAMIRAQQQSEMNGQIQQQSAQQKAQSDAQLKEMEAQMKAQEIKLEGEQSQKTAIVNMFTQLFSKGVGIPQVLAPLSNAVITNIMLPLVVENKDMQQAIIQQMQAEQMAAMQQQPQAEQEAV